VLHAGVSQALAIDPNLKTDINRFNLSENFIIILPAFLGSNAANDFNSGSGFASTKSKAKAATSKKIKKRILGTFRKFTLAINCTGDQVFGDQLLAINCWRSIVGDQLLAINCWRSIVGDQLS
jgi:hypothetical protein